MAVKSVTPFGAGLLRADAPKDMDLSAFAAVGGANAPVSDKDDGAHDNASPSASQRAVDDSNKAKIASKPKPKPKSKPKAKPSRPRTGRPIGAGRAVADSYDDVKQVKGVSRHLLAAAKAALSVEADPDTGRPALVPRSEGEVINMALLICSLGCSMPRPDQGGERIVEMVRVYQNEKQADRRLTLVSEQLERMYSEVLGIRRSVDATRLMTATDLTATLDVTSPEWRTPNHPAQIDFSDSSIGMVDELAGEAVREIEHRNQMRRNPNARRG